MTGWNKLCLVYLTKVAEPGTPPLPTAGFFSLRLMPRYFVRQQGITDDRMMAAPLAPMMGAQTGLKSRKLRFRMIDDIQVHQQLFKIHIESGEGCIHPGLGNVVRKTCAEGMLGVLPFGFGHTI